jgi:predicted nucleic acid-binding protein
MKLVVDASVAVKWYVPEPGSNQAASLLEGTTQLLAPDLLVPEVGNILWKKTRGGELNFTEAQDIVRALLSAPPVVLWPSSLLLQGAFEIAMEFRRPVYDALYVALAVVHGCRFITADNRLVRAARGTALQRFLQPLNGT